ncbi:MAG: hypothetical protein ABEH64_03095 [Salinirussus sp.]
MATRVCEGMLAHDARDREEAIEAFAEVDELQFSHIDADAARRAAIAYVDALWEKDRIERSAMADGELDRSLLAAADWEPVRASFERRADAADICDNYAERHTRAWQRHKTGGDYWTPMMAAIRDELRAALQDARYPRKEHGQSGFGPEPARYALAVELHDMRSKRHWQQNRRVMIPYYERILRGHPAEG